MSFRKCPLSEGQNNLAIAPSFSYAQLNQWASRVSGALHSAGFKKGDSIDLVAIANWQTICILFGAWRLSLIVTLTDPRKNAHVSDELLNGDPYEITDLDLDALALRLSTSGSSGQPKWASFTLRQLFDSADTMAKALRANPQDRWLLSLPLYHVGGLGILLRALLTQGTLVIEDKTFAYPDRLLNANARFASLVPTQLYRLLKSNCTPLSTHLIIGGASMAQCLYERALSHNLNLSLTYGLTEMSSTVLFSAKPVWHRLPYLGHPLKGREMKIVNQEIFVRGASLFSGYGNPPQKIDDWFATGDLGIFHQTYGWAISGRKDFQFTCGGENIQPEEIESIILSMDGIEQAVVVPLFDDEYGARPVAFLRPLIPSEELIASLSRFLPKTKIPIAFVPLPNNTGLKPNRCELTNTINKKLMLN